MDAILLAAEISLAVDYQETRAISRHTGCYEQNPMLGKHPSGAAINRHFVLSAIALPVVYYKLPGGKYVVAGFTIGEAAIIAHNERMGLHASLRF